MTDGFVDRNYCMFYTCQVYRNFNKYIILRSIQMDDHCVYSRSILGRMVSTFSSSANGEGMYSQSQPTANSITPGMIMMVAGILLVLLMTLRNRKRTPQSVIS